MSIKLISELGLYSSIFYIPPAVAKSFSAPVGPASSALAAASVLHTLTHPDVSRRLPLPPLHPVLAAAASHESSTRPRLYLACALTPYRSITYEDAKQKPRSGVEGAIREGTKLGVQNHYLDGVTALFEAADVLKNPTIGGDNERVRMGNQNAVYTTIITDKQTTRSSHAGEEIRACDKQGRVLGDIDAIFPGSRARTVLGHWARRARWYIPSSRRGFANSCVLVVEEAAKRIEAYNAFITRAEALDLLATAHAKALLDVRTILAYDVHQLTLASPGKRHCQSSRDEAAWSMDWGGVGSCRRVATGKSGGDERAMRAVAP